MSKNITTFTLAMMLRREDLIREENPMRTRYQAREKGEARKQGDAGEIDMAIKVEHSRSKEGIRIVMEVQRNVGEDTLQASHETRSVKEARPMLI